MNRCYGNNTQDDFDYWATKYEGDFYFATFDSKPRKFQLKFADQITDCTVNKDKSECNCETTSDIKSVFNVICSSETQFKSTMRLKRGLTADDSNDVIIRLILDDGNFGEGATKNIYVSSKVIF